MIWSGVPIGWVLRCSQTLAAPKSTLFELLVAYSS